MNYLLIFLLVLLFQYISFSERAEQLNPKGFVNDYANLLTPEQRNSLEYAIKTIERNLTIEIAVVTINSLEGDTIENFAVKLFEKWKIGKKNDNGLLILISKNDRQVRIEVGYGLESLITDGRAKRIIDEKMIPYFREGKYYYGLASGINEIVSVITRGNVKEIIYLENKTPWWVPFVFIGIILFFIIFIYLAIKSYGTPTGSYGYRRTSTWTSERDRFGGSFGSGRFGGFGGGMSGGGGASGKW